MHWKRVRPRPVILPGEAQPEVHMVRAFLGPCRERNTRTLEVDTRLINNQLRFAIWSDQIAWCTKMNTRRMQDRVSWLTTTTQHQPRTSQMSNEFLDEVLAKTKAAIGNTGCHTMPD